MTCPLPPTTRRGGQAGNVSPSLPTLDKIADALGAEVSLRIVDLDELTTASSIVRRRGYATPA